MPLWLADVNSIFLRGQSPNCTAFRVNEETAIKRGDYGPVADRHMQRMRVAGADVFGDWVEVQSERYRCVAVQDGDSVLVRLVLSEYLAAEVVWLDEQSPTLW